MKIEDYTKYLSRRSARRQPSAIRAIAPLTTLPGMISLGGGNPNACTFPFKSVSFGLKDGSTVNLTDADLGAALQYSPSYGLKVFVDKLTAFQQSIHNPPYSPFAVVISNGSQDLMSKTFDMLLNEEDYLLVENPTYPGALGALKPIGCHLVGVQSDENGLIPAALENILANWDKSKLHPKALYLIPNGQNPSGASLSLERKQAIYAIACQYDIILIEDDPYYFLTYPTEPPTPPTPTLFSMDVERRVLRLDSFSKVMSSGVRIGYATGPSFLIERLQLDMQVTLLHVSGLSQMAVYALLNTWGSEGWNKHVRAVQEFYKGRAEVFCKLAKKHLDGLATWKEPTAGMFLWFKLLGVSDTRELIQKKAMEKKVLLVPGEFFDPDGKPSSYVRASFSTATDSEMDEALTRFASLLKQ